eukprot:PITA_20212
MKNIPPATLPNFHGLSSEDLDEFLFEFDILCRSYDYVNPAQKLKLFPATLKGNVLRWFMSLGAQVITTWDQMKESFLTKYQDYCRTRERKEELFKMVQKEDENLEDFVERLQYNLQRSDHPTMSKDILKTILLKGVRDDCLDMLNMLGKGDISKEPFDDIINLCMRCSRGAASKPKSRDSIYSRVQKSASGGATRAEIGNLLEEFKTEMLSSFASQIDALQVKRKQAEAEAALAILCSKCREKHPLRECPLDRVPICTISEKDHETQQCPSLPGIKAALQSTEEEAEAVYLMTQRRQWQPQRQEETRKEKSSNNNAEAVESSSNKTAQTAEPPFPERLALTKTFEPPAFNLLGEMQNLYVKIPLLQALRDVPIYARTVRDIFIKKPGRKAKEPLTVHVMRELTALMTEKDPPVKYGDPGHPTVTVQVGKTFVSKVLVDLGAAINIMTLETAQLLHLKHLIRETPTILELADRSTIKPEGVIEDLETKQLTLYPHATPMINNDNSVWLDYEDEETQPILTVGQALTFKDSTEDELINNFISEPSSVSPEIHNHFTAILESESQQNLETENLPQTLAGSSSKSITVEIDPGKTLNINPNLTDDQKQQLMKLLRENREAFAWDYTDMKGISPELCTHRIYIKEESRPVCQPQRRMNPNLREIVKEELHKLLNAGFIYPISDNEWVSPLVIVPKKNGKWRVCVDYRALNKATQKDPFPLPFIDQVLDNLAGKKFFSFLDGFSGYNQIKIAPQDQDKTTFTSPWGTFAYRVLPFGLRNAPATFQRAVIGIFSDMINDSLEIFMDDFTPYGTTFEDALQNLEKVLKQCIEAHLALSTEKCHMMMNQGIVLGHFVSFLGIQVDPAKIQVIQTLPIPKTQTDVRSFLGHAGYYRRFIKNFSKTASPLFVLLTKNVEFKWTDDCEKAFDELKHQLSTAPILKGPDWALPFHISSDASGTAIGAVLGQEENNLPYAIYFISKNMTPAKLNYTVTEKEFLAVIYAINKFRHYITGYTTFVHTDHSAIKYLMNKSITNARVTRWLLLLQEFDITIVDRPGKENVVADFLSRLKINENIPVDDSFPDEYLFAVSAHSPWYADIANYLVARKLPSHLSHREKRKIIQQSARYSWISGCLFHTGLDQEIQRCIGEDQIYDVMKACHDGPCGGHFAELNFDLGNWVNNA